MPMRNFECSIYGGPCSNRECRNDFCAREKDEMQRDLNRAPAPQKSFRPSRSAQQRLREIIAKVPRVAGKVTD